jgi:hypothetical protein
VASPEHQLTVRLGLGRDPDVIGDVFRTYLDAYRQVSAATSRKGASLNLMYRVRLKPSVSMTALTTELNLIEGVQEVELRS